MRELIARKLAGTAPADPARAGRRPELPGDLPAELRARVRGKLTPAAVLVPLVDRPAGLQMLLTERTDHLKHHPGQVSFPGGRVEQGDDGPVAAALRETYEEIGLAPEFVEIAGFLDNYLTVTGYSVTPVVGFVREGFRLELDSFEVKEAFEVPLSYVLATENHIRREREMFGAEISYYEIPYRGRNIWGATAGMIRNLREYIYADEIT